MVLPTISCDFPMFSPRWSQVEVPETEELPEEVRPVPAASPPGRSWRCWKFFWAKNGGNHGKKHGNMMGKTLENDGKKHWKMMGKSWENHGKNMAKSWETHGKIMEIRWEILWEILSKWWAWNWRYLFFLLDGFNGKIPAISGWLGAALIFGNPHIGIVPWCSLEFLLWPLHQKVSVVV